MSNIIPITSGVGRGPTKLSAFDAALYDAGIANHNLIHLSSIIPDGWEPIVSKLELNDVEYGYRLYVVLSSCTVTEIGQEACAGLGWVMSTDDPKHGLFVEHSGASNEEVQVAIKESLTSMIAYRPESYTEIKEEIIGIVCEGKPACAVVVAVYKSEPWAKNNNNLL